MKRPASLRTVVLFVPYAFAVWMTAYQGLRGDDAAGLVCVLLLLAGAALLINLAFFRRTVQPHTFSAVAAGALVLLGLGFGAMSRGESGVGMVAGLAVGGIAAVGIALAARRKRRRPKTIFLSYRRADSGDVVPRIRERLTERFGAENIFWDIDSMELGGPFREIISDAVNHADAFIAVIGDQWLTLKDEAGRPRIEQADDLVRIEIETALRKPRLLVVPLAVKGANIPRPGDLPESVRGLVSRSGGVVRSPPDFEADMSRLIRGLEQGSITPWSRAAPAPVRWSLVAAMTAIVLLPPAGLLLELPAAAYRSMNAAALRPGASMLATAHGVGIGVRSRVRLWNTGTGATVHTLVLDRGPVWSVAWSPDGSRLAYGDHDGALVILQSDTWREQARFKQHMGMLQQIAWAPNGDLIASGDQSGMVRVWSAGSAELRFAAAAHTNRVEMVQWSSDGKRLATASWDQTAAIIDAATGRIVQRFEGYRSFVTAVAWSPDGRRLATASLEAPYLVIWNTEETGADIEPAGLTTAVDTLAWSPDGLWLATASGDHTVRVWNASGSMVQAFDLNGIGSPDLAWSPDGTRLAVGDDRNVSIFEARSGSRLQQWVAHDGDYEVVIVGWSRDGRTLASRGKGEDAVKVWNAESGQLLATAKVGLLRGLRDRFF